MRSQTLTRNLQLAAVVALGVAAAAALGAGIVHWQLGARELVILILGGALGALALSNRPQVTRAGFYLWIATFTIGWRQLWITYNLRVHPAEVVIWLLLPITMLHVNRQHQARARWLPYTFGLFLLLCVAGVATALANHIPIDVIAAELKPFITAVPVLYVTRYMVQTVRDLRFACGALALAMLVVASMGIVEYVLARAGIYVPFLVSEGAIVYSQQGFARALFSFFGAQIASIFIATTLFLNLSLAWDSGPVWQKAIWLVGLGVGLIGVFWAGNRAPWVGAALGLLVFAVLDFRRRWYVPLLAVAAIPLLPGTWFNHLYAVIDPYQFYDTSVLQRRDLFQAALASALSNPLLGRGLGSSGWVHSDLLQIASNLGFPALALFLAWAVSRMWNLWRAARRSPDTKLAIYAAALLSCLIAALVSLSAEAALVLPPLIIPIWFVLALADAATDLAERGPV